MKIDEVKQIKKQLLDLLEKVEKVEAKPEVPVKKRGRPPKQKQESKKNKNSEYDKFKINPPNFVSNGDSSKNYGKKSSLENFDFKNNFNPKQSEVKQTVVDKKLSKKFKPSARDREEFQGQIEVKCDKCSKKYMAYPNEVNIKISGDDERMENTCQKCIRDMK